MSLAALIEKMKRSTYRVEDVLKLCKAAEVLKYALAEECYCTGETSDKPPFEPIYCEACEALQKADSICAEVKL